MAARQAASRCKSMQEQTVAVGCFGPPPHLLQAVCQAQHEVEHGRRPRGVRQRRDVGGEQHGQRAAHAVTLRQRRGRRGKQRGAWFASPAGLQASGCCMQGGRSTPSAAGCRKAGQLRGEQPPWQVLGGRQERRRVAARAGHSRRPTMSDSARITNMKPPSSTRRCRHELPLEAAPGCAAAPPAATAAALPPLAGPSLAAGLPAGASSSSPARASCDP